MKIVEILGCRFLGQIFYCLVQETIVGGTISAPNNHLWALVNEMWGLKENDSCVKDFLRNFKYKSCALIAFNARLNHGLDLKKQLIRSGIMRHEFKLMFSFCYFQLLSMAPESCCTLSFICLLLLSAYQFLTSCILRTMQTIRS